MGRLQHIASKATWLLTQRCILGRSRACTVRIVGPDVSGEHASLRWTGGAWELQDLHSRNGSFVGGHRLGPGERVPLSPGCVLGLGRAESLVLLDAGPPEAFAAPLGAGPQIAAIGGLLALPDPAAPDLMIFPVVGGWMVERAGEVVPVADGEIVRSGGHSWQLHLPEVLPETEESGLAPPSIDAISLRFHVSRDEEYIELVALHGTRMFDLKARSYHYTLLTLARARLRDRAMPSEQQGWVHQNDLLAMLRVDPGHLHLDIYRLRRQLGEAGIVDAARVVERRQGTRALRIGVARLEICLFTDETRPDGSPRDNDAVPRASDK